MHLKTFTLFLLVIQFFIGFAQEKKLEYSLDYSIGQSFRRIDGDNRTVQFRENEIPTITHGVNFQLKYSLSERLGIVSGFGYNQYGEETNYEDLTYGYMIDPRIGFVYTPVSSSDPTSAKRKYVYNFLSVPLLVNYAIIHKEKSDLDIQIGVTVNYLIGSRTISKTRYSDGKKDRNSTNYSFDSNDVNFAGLMGIFYKRKLGEKYFLKVGPQINYFFTSISGSNVIEHYPYRTSINLGIGF